MIKRIITFLIAGANTLTLLLLWLSCASTFLAPDILPYASVMGLAMPVLAAINIGFIVIWLVFEWRGVWLPILGMLPVMGFLLDYCPLNLRSYQAGAEFRASSGQIPGKFPPDTSQTEREIGTKSTQDSTDSLSNLVVCSFNVFYWQSQDSTDGEWNFKLLAKKINADILFLQEAGFTSETPKKILEELGYDTRQLDGRALCSRLPFVGESLHVATTNSENGYLAWRVVNGTDTILLVNCHLESTRISPEEKKLFSENVIHPKKEELRSSGKIVLSQIITAMQAHKAETDSMCLFLDKHKGESIILCGDFNDTPISYSYQKISKQLTSAFRESGLGFGWTYNTPGFWGRIDHIFYSPDWESKKTLVVKEYCASDHLPIVTTIHKK